jgi:hypothetical protein
MEWGNYGAGSDTSARKYETVATGPVSKQDIFGDNWKWYDASF